MPVDMQDAEPSVLRRRRRTTSRLRRSVTTGETIKWCRVYPAACKCPKTVVFSELPNTAAGKIQKFALRERAKKL